MKVDNNHDGKEDITFQFRFTTEIRNPGVFTGMVGGIPGIPPITALDGDGSQGLGLRQTYTVTMVTKQGATPLGVYQTLFAVPSNVGPRTMPNYAALQAQDSMTCRAVSAFSPERLPTRSSSTWARLSIR